MTYENYGSKKKKKNIMRVLSDNFPYVYGF